MPIPSHMYRDGRYGTKVAYGQTKVPPLPVFHEHKPSQRRPNRRTRLSVFMGISITVFLVFIALLYISLTELSSPPLESHADLAAQATPWPQFNAPLAGQHQAIIDEWRDKQLSEDEQRQKDLGFERNAFNQFMSDKLPLDRQFPDYRQPECFDQRYHPNDVLPTTSVIVIFHNEAISTLLRTAWSVINRSPARLIAEVLLVDDASTGDWLKTPEFEAQVTGIPKTRLLRLPERSGLIRAKVAGAQAAKGEVITFLDSHCECNPGWLEPLLDRIRRNPHAVAVPIIDVIDHDTFEYRPAGSTTQIGMFTWHMQFSWTDITDEERRRRKSPVDPVASPAMAGGLFAMQRDYFFESGSYDMGQKTWGGENLEMSFRLWMCGARIESVPCSRVGHVFRDRNPVKFADADPGTTITRNLNRVAAVWMDQYASIYHELTNSGDIDPGDIEERKQLRKQLQCQSFEWYLETVFPAMFVPIRDNLRGRGSLRNTLGGCISLTTTAFDDVEELKLSACGAGQSDLSLTDFYYSARPLNQLRKVLLFGDMCMQPSQEVDKEHQIIMDSCQDPVWTQWKYLDTQQLYHPASDKCIGVAGGQNDRVPSMVACKRSPAQRWLFSSFSPFGRNEQIAND
eukprot:TRINITY_DN7434_c0_g1_i3.p1 TRINITY_DN7434_c0_g1~~TRINITY_DN7434_c0_g1_i3.p1  ORF type:complete len:639 (+),score=132.37 TRINITY_DN7434_c0_g1_i3:41-1918(+)